MGGCGVYANLCEGLLHSSERVKFQFVRCSLMSVASWRWARWPYCAKTDARVNGVQSHFVQILFRVFQRRFESAYAFFSRKRLRAGRFSSNGGKWSLHFAGAVKSWAKHLKDVDFNEYWCSQINSYMGFEHMERLRVEKSRGSMRDRTNTRASHGHVHLRWHDGLDTATGVALKSSICAKTRFSVADNTCRVC